MNRELLEVAGNATIVKEEINRRRDEAQLRPMACEPPPKIYSRRHCTIYHNTMRQQILTHTMICQSCLRRVRIPSGLSSAPLSTFTSRRLVGTGQPSTPAPGGVPGGSHEGPPAATSSSAAQPFSSQMNDVAHLVVLPQKEAERPKSSVPGGAVLKGLGFFKNKDPPLAMEDHEYPDWLWSLLQTSQKAKSKTGDGEADLYCKLIAW